MAYKRTLSTEHKRKISDGVRRAWARVPIAPDKGLYLNLNYDENNKENFRVYTDDGQELRSK